MENLLEKMQKNEKMHLRNSKNFAIDELREQEKREAQIKMISNMIHDDKSEISELLPEVSLKYREEELSELSKEETSFVKILP